MTEQLIVIDQDGKEVVLEFVPADPEGANLPIYVATPAMQELIDAVKERALRDYETGGWDVIVECWTDEDIANQIEGAKTAAGAIAKMSATVRIYRDRDGAR